ncbi:helix-turn-helix transcriptional regulator [Dasania marina]|uniref:LuxR family transcriptional regulator n=1 Tax=Dasania marina TaxID=471499 RepID=UPI0030DA6E5C|tara:strand:- start:82300 stop:83151 length:852 start_codon:yes stop_codon:yes gene_type:complete
MSDVKDCNNNGPWVERVAAVISELGSDAFWPCLADLIAGVVAIDDCMVLLFMRGQIPVILHGRSSQTEISLLEKSYINGAYVLDPCFQAARRQQWGYYSFVDIAPDGFYDSELYSIYHAQSIMLDEAGYLIEGEGESFINISLARFESSPEFNAQEKALLQQVEPVVAAAVKEYLRQHISRIAEEKRPLHKMMAEVLELFGTSVLTSRETHVIHLILKGYSAKSIAEHLDISINTVKLHRKNAYAKLDISSQSELFHLFIDSLSCLDEDYTRDSLVMYLQVPG